MPYSHLAFPDVSRFPVVIEIEKGSNLKYEYDDASDSFILDFTFSPEVVFPYSYGFIPQTLAGDGDALDVFVISSSPLMQGDIVVCRALGYAATLDKGKEDDKIIAVPVDDSAYKNIREVSELEQSFKETLTDFYARVAKEKKKQIMIIGFQDAGSACERISQMHKRFIL